MLAGILALTGCASGPQTAAERRSQLATQVGDSITEAAAGVDRSSVSVGTGNVVVDIAARDGDDWDMVESQLRAAVDVLAVPPFNAFESRIGVSSSGQLRWDLYHPDDLSTTLAATRVWFDARELATDEAVVEGDTVQFYFATSDDPSQQRAALIEALEAAGIDVERSTIVVSATG